MPELQVTLNQRLANNAGSLLFLFWEKKSKNYTGKKKVVSAPDLSSFAEMMRTEPGKV